jgi:hypothetical protein
MKNVFPEFVPFAEPGVWAGFRGWLRGKRTGRFYETVLRTSIAKYPNEEPGVYMNPRPESHHWIGDGRLCYMRQGHVWNPAEDTFAQALVVAARYVDEFDGRN